MTNGLALKPHLSAQQSRLDLVRCDGFRAFGDVEPLCVAQDGAVYVARQDDEEQELRSVLTTNLASSLSG